MPGKERNEDIDLLRGLAMMWVIFIRCLFHLGLFSDPIESAIKSLLLLEMPLFFFITGVSNSLGSKKVLLAFYLARIQRVLIPFFVLFRGTRSAVSTKAVPKPTTFALPPKTIIPPTGNAITVTMTAIPTSGLKILSSDHSRYRPSL